MNIPVYATGLNIDCSVGNKTIAEISSTIKMSRYNYNTEPIRMYNATTGYPVRIPNNFSIIFSAVIKKTHRYRHFADHRKSGPGCVYPI